MIPGLMQTTPLMISGILTYAAQAHGAREIVSRLIDEPVWRYDYAGLARRAAQLAHALKRLGVKAGDRVTSLAWNTHRHLELFYAVPGIGAVLHTANPRLFDEQIVYTINHAESGVLFFDRNFLPLVERIAAQLTTVKTFVMLSDAERTERGSIGAASYETLIADELEAYPWPSFDENAGAFLCYTSGTTGDPKGVLYSHRAVVLHAMAGGLNSAFGFTAFDVVMPCSSLYHATAWGLPFSAPICGAKLVLPADKMDGASLHQLIEGEGVTFTGGVPTIWTMYLDWLERNGQAPTALKRVVIGGSAVPRAMAEAFKRRYDVQTLQIWGMTETCPIGVVSTPTPSLAALGEAAMDEAIWTRQGRLQFGIELKVETETGAEAPWDGETSGALLVRGPWVVRRYFRKDEDAARPDGWFDTGDIATLDAHGFMRITDRQKDVIKSGGEWISSIDLENIAVGCPGVKIAAVIGVPHPKWEERPLLVIEPHDGVEVGKDAVLAFLAPRIVKWWTPDDVVFARVPLTATGKIDKKVLREAWRGHLMG
ncbi:long-chain fatty acid--CoA ligase [uncultured Caulobacter sp.]|uniref:long-chain fatty acid--CoA ligase n=1 Tax=uncultured Caulobacter sp. TaxID=158749 RepID=UPI0026293845|nr:long-chain fatty acid--CoA ligase [uncultured Caulobacter sp.]